MRVVLKKTLLGKVIEAVEDALADNQDVEKVVVTRPEMRELLAAPLDAQGDPLGQRVCMKDGELYVHGVPVVLDDALAPAHG